MEFITMKSFTASKFDLKYVSNFKSNFWNKTFENKSTEQSTKYSNWNVQIEKDQLG